MFVFFLIQNIGTKSSPVLKLVPLEMISEPFPQRSSRLSQEELLHIGNTAESKVARKEKHLPVLFSLSQPAGVREHTCTVLHNQGKV